MLMQASQDLSLDPHPYRFRFPSRLAQHSDVERGRYHLADTSHRHRRHEAFQG